MAAGCSNSQIILSQELKIEEFLDLLDELGLFALPVLEQSGEDEPRRFVIRSLEELISGDSELWVSPLQMASAAAVFSSGGVRPVPQIATGVNLPDQGWTLFSPSVEQYQIFSQSNVEGIANSIADEHLPIWESISVSPNGLDEMITWYMAGTLPSWSGAPLSLVIVLEEDDALEARRIGKAMMEAALKVE
jgi:hypothetical protein